MMRPGFTIVQILIFIAVASMMSLSLFQSFYQTNRIYQSADSMMDSDLRILHVQDRLEKDITGAFIPLFMPPQKKKGEITIGEKNNQKEDDKQKKTKKEPAPFMPIEKAFYSVNKDKRLTEFTCITNNPFISYDSLKPRIARVRYVLELDEAHKGAFKLMRQESSKLNYALMTSSDKPQSYVLADNIKSIKIDFYSQPEHEKGKEVKAEDETVVKSRSWSSDARAKSKKEPRQLLPTYLEMTIILFNAKGNQELEYEFLFPIYADPDPELPQPEKDDKPDQQRGLDIDAMPQMRRTIAGYQQSRWQQQQGGTP